MQKANELLMQLTAAREEIRRIEKAIENHVEELAKRPENPNQNRLTAAKLLIRGLGWSLTTARDYVNNLRNNPI